MEKVTGVLLLSTCLVMATGCSKNSSTSNNPGPVISNLSYDPKTVTLRPNSTFTFVGSINYENASGGVAKLRLTSSAGADVTVVVPQNASSGLLTGAMEVVMPPSPGNYTFDLWVIDANGNSSNKLSGTVQAIIDDRGNNWRIVSRSWELHRVIWANNQYIAVGNHGVIVTSPDGDNWHQENSGVQNSGIDVTLYGIAWSGSIYVAVGQCKTILTSPDGSNWTVRSSDISGCALHAVATSGSDFVAVGGSPPGGIEIFHSTDGITWTRTFSQSGNKSLNSVRWVNNKYIAVGGYPMVMMSTDGLAWTEQNVSGDAGGELWDFAYSGTKYAAVGSAVTASSNDGINWNTQMTNWASGGVAWSGNKFVAGTITDIVSSADGVNWTKVCEAPYPLRNITWSGMQYVAVGFISPVIMVSP